MRAFAAVLSYAAGGAVAGLLPTARTVDMPGPEPYRRGPRLGFFGAELCDRLLAAAPGRVVDGVVVGTSRGCMTESNRFLELMIRHQETSPAPRAFSGSVHNAVASLTAIRFDARRLCRTPAHGVTSCVVAIDVAERALRRGEAAGIVAGAVDERPGFLSPAYADAATVESEGGGLLLLAPLGTAGALASVRAAFARPYDAAAWCAARAAEDPPDLLLFGGDRLFVPSTSGPAVSYGAYCGVHPAAAATAVAWAVAMTCGDAPTAVPGGARAPQRIGVATASRFGDASYATVVALL